MAEVRTFLVGEDRAPLTLLFSAASRYCRKLSDELTPCLPSWRPAVKKTQPRTRQQSDRSVPEASAVVDEPGNGALREAQRLLHELQVHQIELEQQNQELLQLRDEVEAGLARYMDLYDFAPVGYLTLRPNGEILQLNLAAASLLGTQRAQAIGARFGAFIRPADRRMFAEFLPRAFGSSAQQTCVVTLDGAQGATVQLQTSSSESAETCRVAMLDISQRIRDEAEREHLAAQLRESQKMEALGTLAGGIAHDFNNILGIIIGNTALGRESLGYTHPARDCFSEIGKAATRAKRLVEQILAFSRKRPTLFVPLALQPIVTEVARLMRATLPANIALDVTAPEHPVHVHADSVQLQQVLLNLLTNAFEAMPVNGGRIVLSIGEQDVTARAVFGSEVLEPGRYARIAIEDSGHGMTKEIVDRIFEPFFTTKPVEKGTGLGLSVAHGIIKNHRGAISVTSRVGEGTRFEIRLPILEMPEPLEQSPTPSREPASIVDARILYVDDDESMIFMVKRFLERRGYRVTSFERSDDAIAAVRANPRSFDLVVTDYNMPGPSGLDVARELAAIRADLPIVITSGYVTEELQAAAQRLGVRHVLYKPNTTDELCEQIHRILSTTDLRQSSGQEGAAKS